MRYVIIFLLALSSAGCDRVREQLHMLPNQDEQACLNSERFNFKDPDVQFVANLGDRGMKLKENQYWVRYKAKNSYGAYLQGNMLCEKDQKGNWVNAQADQYIALLHVQNFLLEKINERMRSGDKEVFEQFKYKKGPDWAEEKAQQILLESADNVAMYFRGDETSAVKP